MWRHHRNPPKDLRDKPRGHGRKRRSEDVPKIDGPKRRRIEVGEGTGNTPRPIGFRELENICKEDLVEKAILGLNNKAKNFEALLALEEIRPDLLKLVISAFRRLCSASNLMKENSEKLLRSPVVKNFMTGTVLLSFINEMPHSECWKDENDRASVISDLTEIFLALIQRFGESIVHVLPLQALSASFDELKEMNLIEDASDLDKKIRQVKDLRIEVIRRAKTAQDQQSGPEPPQNFRELSVIPQTADLCSKPFLRENITDRRFKDLEHYLDVQFRLLREDFVMPLRDGIKQLTKESYALETKPAGVVKRANDVSVYHDVTILHPVCSRKGRVYRIRFDRTHPKVMRVNWERSKRLKFGSLVCLSSDEFRTLIFASVENRDAEGLKVGELDVRFENVSMEEINQFVQRQENFVMIETPAYFEAYRHILEALKEIKPDELPFQKHVVECCKDVGPPDYQVRKADNSGFAFNFTGVLAVETSENPAIPVSGERHEFHSLPTEVILDSSSQESQPESGISQDPTTSVDVPMDEEPPSAGVKVECTADLHKWPDSESLGFNDSQMRAFKLALTKKFAVIQGPPGTGKTYVGLKIARVLLQTASLWEDEEERSPILMVSYTNHALDQFLEGLMSTTKDIVRVGGRSRSEKLKFVSLKNLQESMRLNRLVPDQIHRARMRIVEESDRQKRFFERSFELLRILKSSIVSMKVFGHPGYMLTAHYTQLLENAWQGSIDEALLDWLGIEKSAGQEDKDYFDDIDDELDDFSAPGFTYDNSPFDDKNLNSPSLQLEALSIEEVADTQYVRRKLTNEEVMTEDEEVLVDDIYFLETEDRWKLYRLWRQRVKAYHQGLFEARQGEYERALERKQEVTRVEEYEILRKARVIGMTTTCAARYRHILQQIRPRIVLVEEAAEVFEAHIITSLTSGCEHLILIGDHQQLRPAPAVYELAKKYKLDVSLFERMVNVGIQCERLSVQHRMRPEIAALMRHIYDDLGNHKSVENYEDIKGIKKNMYFIDHKYLEKSCDQSHSHVNEHEAKFVVALCRYLLQQGYKPDQITILTTYMGQMFAIRDCLREGNDETVRNVRLSTVDNFQGEENDIILLSLVRSNKTKQVGFIKIVNRACVALSRAKKGFYCIGNFSLLSKHSDIWKKIVADLKASGSIGNALPLFCRIHHDEIAVKTAEDFSEKAPDGGCQRPCEVRLECGHACKQFCHPYDTKHREYQCRQPCSKKIVGCDHDCPNLCWEECERNCGVLVTKKVLGCGHPSEVRCDTNPRRMTCKQRCQKDLSCGHQCQDYCGAPCTKKCQELVKKTDWPCGHGATIACSATPADCQVPCQDKLECGHKCSGVCGDCRMGRVHKRCKMRCGRPLICSHLCKESCRTPCPPCTSKCENRCVHSVCPKTCGEPCNPCREKCDWECLHYKCSKQCGELCDRPTCDEPCNKILPCQHQCRGLMCEEECICTDCMTNDGHEPITEIFFGTEQDEDARFIKLPDCQHIFELKGLDSYMGISNDVTDEIHADNSQADITQIESEEIQLKPCPRCKTPIRRSLRYGNIIKQQLHDIEKVKATLLGNSKELEEKKNRLYRRVNKVFVMLDVKKEGEKMRSSIHKLKSTWMATVYENRWTLMERFCDMGKKLRSVLGKVSLEICTENNLQRKQFKNELEYLKKRFMSDGVTQTELKDIDTEFSRLNLLLELCLLSHDIKSLEVEIDEPSRQMMTAVKEKLSSGKRIEDEKLNEMMTNLKDIRETHSKLPVLTEEEKKMIVSAMGLSKGHWFKCPKGHIYAIDRCGGATERGTCPECGAVIGGENHQLVDDNELAPEMDGATHPAWSEQANLLNYENLHNIV